MEHRIHTIFEVAEEAARRQKKERPHSGTRKVKSTRKASARTSRRPAAKKASRTARRK